MNIKGKRFCRSKSKDLVVANLAQEALDLLEIDKRAGRSDMEN